MVNVYLISKMAKVIILQLVTKQSILIFIQNLYIDFRIEFQYEGFIFIVLCNRLHKSFDFLESVTKLVLYKGWKRFPVQRLTGGD